MTPHPHVRTLCTMTLALCLIGHPARPETRHVTPGQSIQAAIEAASDGDVVLVAPGTYTESIDFLGKAIHVRSSAGAAATIIDATGLDASVAVFVHDETADSILDGFTITGGVGHFPSAPEAGYGGGILISRASPTVIGCVIRDNVAGQGGGGVSILNGAAPHLVNCLIHGNSAGEGGAVYSVGWPVFQSCTIAGNTAQISGGGVHNTHVWGGIDLTVKLINSIVHGNAPDQIVDVEGAETQPYFAIVQGGYLGLPTVIDADPMFIDPAAGDHRPGRGSPAIDAGHNYGVPDDLADLDGDGDTLEFLPLDLAGGPRFADDPAVPDTGCGIAAIVDLGPYEAPGIVQDPARRGDLDGDGLVGTTDLLILLDAWGPAGPDQCSISGADGAVNAIDLEILLEHWS